MSKKQKKSPELVQFTVFAERSVRDKLRILGARSGDGLGRESGRRLAESIKRDRSINWEAIDA